MIFDNLNLHTSSIRKEIENFLTLTSRRYWEKTINKIDNNSIFYKQYQYARNPLLLPIFKYLSLDKKGKSINKERTPEILFLSEQSFIINKIVRNLNDKAKRSVVSRITSDDTRSILFEISMAAHFLRNKYEVEFVEYEREKDIGKTFDLFIKKDGINAEVECKSKSYESGRKIRRDSFYLLSDVICRKLKRKKISCIIDIKMKNALQSKQIELEDIAVNVVSLIDSEIGSSFHNEYYSISIHQLNINKPIESADELEKIVSPYRTEYCHLTSLSAANDLWNVIIKIECENSDEIVSSIFEELKNAKSQFSRKHPCLLAIKIEGVHPEEWALLQSGGSLGIMTHHFFETENCPFIDTIAYSSDPVYINYGKFIDSSTKNLLYRNHLSSYSKYDNLFQLRKR